MNDSKVRLSLEAKFTLELNEAEIGALDAIFGYGADAFLKAFKKELGEAYVRPYESGVRSLHDRVRRVTSPALSEIKRVRDRVNAALREESKP